MPWIDNFLHNFVVVILFLFWYYNIINDVETIPDVATESVNGGKVLTLYRAGIVMGADKYGTFNPESNLKRSEAAAIINRVALPENRLNKILEKIEHKECIIYIYTEKNSSL